MRLKGLLLSIAPILALGCGEDECDCYDPYPVNGYATPSAPESLIFNLQHSYRRREIEEYTKILASEFTFKFQPVDQGTIGKESWTHDEDSVGTRALLTSPEVADIRIRLLYAGRDSSIDKIPPADSVRIRILTTDLQVEQTNAIEWVVTDQQDFFFRKGLPGNGENPAHWFMYEWDDLPSLGSPRFSTVPFTWGRLKTLFESS